MFVETFTFWGHHTVEGENKWCKGPMLHIDDPVIVHALLLCLLLGKDLLGGEVRLYK